MKMLFLVLIQLIMTGLCFAENCKLLVNSDTYASDPQIIKSFQEKSFDVEKIDSLQISNSSMLAAGISPERHILIKKEDSFYLYTTFIDEPETVKDWFPLSHRIEISKLKEKGYFSCNSVTKNLSLLKDLRKQTVGAIKEIYKKKQSEFSWGNYFLTYENYLILKSRGLTKYSLSETKKKYEDLLLEFKNKFPISAETFFQDWLKAKKLLFSNQQQNIDYCRDNTLMTQALMAKCTNCVGQTSLIISLIKDSKINLPVDWILSVQYFKDHIRPVLYNKKESLTYDLVYTKFEKQKSAIALPEDLLIHSLKRFDLLHVKEKSVLNQNSLLFKELICPKSVFDVGKVGRLQVYDFAGTPNCGKFGSDGPIPEKADMEESSVVGNTSGDSGASSDDKSTIINFLSQLFKDEKKSSYFYDNLTQYLPKLNSLEKGIVNKVIENKVVSKEFKESFKIKNFFLKNGFSELEFKKFFEESEVDPENVFLIKNFYDYKSRLEEDIENKQEYSSIDLWTLYVQKFKETESQLEKNEGFKKLLSLKTSEELLEIKNSDLEMAAGFLNDTYWYRYYMLESIFFNDSYPGDYQIKEKITEILLNSIQISNIEISVKEFINKFILNFDDFITSFDNYQVDEKEQFFIKLEYLIYIYQKASILNKNKSANLSKKIISKILLNEKFLYMLEPDEIEKIRIAKRTEFPMKKLSQEVKNNLPHINLPQIASVKNIGCDKSGQKYVQQGFLVIECSLNAENDSKKMTQGEDQINNKGDVDFQTLAHENESGKIKVKNKEANVIFDKPIDGENALLDQMINNENDQAYEYRKKVILKPETLVPFLIIDSFESYDSDPVLKIALHYISDANFLNYVNSKINNYFISFRSALSAWVFLPKEIDKNIFYLTKENFEIIMIEECKNDFSCISLEFERLINKWSNIKLEDRILPYLRDALPFVQLAAKEFFDNPRDHIIKIGHKDNGADLNLISPVGDYSKLLEVKFGKFFKDKKNYKNVYPSRQLGNLEIILPFNSGFEELESVEWVEVAASVGVESFRSKLKFSYINNIEYRDSLDLEYFYASKNLTIDEFQKSGFKVDPKSVQDLSQLKENLLRNNYIKYKKEKEDFKRRINNN